MGKTQAMGALCPSVICTEAEEPPYRTAQPRRRRKNNIRWRWCCPPEGYRSPPPQAQRSSAFRWSGRRFPPRRPWTRRWCGPGPHRPPGLPSSRRHPPRRPDRSPPPCRVPAEGRFPDSHSRPPTARCHCPERCGTGPDWAPHTLRAPPDPPGSCRTGPQVPQRSVRWKSGSPPPAFLPLHSRRCAPAGRTPLRPLYCTGSWRHSHRSKSRMYPPLWGCAPQKTR